MKPTMISSVMLSTLLSVSTLVAASSRAQVTPTEKVIDLLSSMVEKGKEDKKAEQTQFAAYKQFCDDTSTEKTRAITEAEELISMLKADIEKYTADAERAAKEIEEHEADIAAWEGDRDAATKVRNFEKETYVKTSKDYTESIYAIENAEETLKKELAHVKATTDTFIQVSNTKQVSSLTGISLIPPEARQTINAFLQQKAGMGLSEAPEATTYGFQSDGIIDLLEKLDTKFTDEKTELDHDEDGAKSAYEILMADLKAQLDAANADVKEKSKFKATCLEKKADAEGSIADTTATKEADEKYLADLKATCKQKATDFASRQELRAEEIVAVEKAIEILSSDAVSGAAKKHLPTMIQGPHVLKVQGDRLVPALAQVRVDARSSNMVRAVSFLKEQAHELNSRVLTAVAERAESDPFKKVKKMISDLLEKLMQEASDEADSKSHCDNELATNEQTRKEKTESVETTSAEIDELVATIAKLTDEMQTLQGQIKELATAMAKATNIRIEEKDKNTVTIADAKAAAVATAKAIGVLKDFYAKAGEATAFVQQENSEPEIFDAPYKGMGAENGGVVGMLEVIAEDFSRLEADTTADETAAAAEYKQFMSDSKADTASKNKDIEHKTTKKQDKEQALMLAKEDLEGTQEELAASLKYYEKLKNQCLDSKVDYADRVARRKAELASLQQALDILSE